jgi:hypothetical protein
MDILTTCQAPAEAFASIVSSKEDDALLLDCKFMLLHAKVIRKGGMTRRAAEELKRLRRRQMRSSIFTMSAVMEHEAKPFAEGVNGW